MNRYVTLTQGLTRAQNSADREHDLSSGMAVDASLVGPTRLCQRNNLIDDGPQMSRLDQGTNPTQLLAARFDREVDETHRWAR